MKIKVKNEAELRASVLSKIEAWTGKGFSDAQAKGLAQDYLNDNEFEDAEGSILKFSIESMKAPANENADAIGQAVKKAIEPLLETMGKVKGKAPDRIEVKEPWEVILDGSDPKWGFKNVGDFALSVFNENHPVMTKRATDPRLGLISKAAMAVKSGMYTKATPTTYSSELVGADGGFLVPPEFRQEIWVAVHDDYSILSLIDMTPTSSNTVNLNVDITAPWQGQTGTGIQVYWRQQAATMTQAKPVFQNRQITLNELYGLVPATDEILADAPMLNNYLSQKVPELMGYAVDDSIFRGTGQGQPLGYLNHPATVSVAANSTASGYSLTDFANMYPHLLQGPNMVAPDGVWIMTPREYALLPTLGTGSNAGFPLALTNQSIEGRIILSCLGMPIYSSQHAPGKDMPGSITLARLKGYMGFNKTDGFDFQSSIHLFFDSGSTALRWRFRFGGEPALRSTIASANDTGNTMSHFVVLGGRNGN